MSLLKKVYEHERLDVMHIKEYLEFDRQLISILKISLIS